METIVRVPTHSKHFFDQNEYRILVLNALAVRYGKEQGQFGRHLTAEIVPVHSSAGLEWIEEVRNGEVCLLVEDLCLEPHKARKLTQAESFRPSEKQLAVATAIAGAHGHAWTFMRDQITSWVKESQEVVSVGVIRALTTPNYWGVEAPSVGLGHLIGATGTGRLSWAVDSDGETRLDVCRPGAKRGESVHVLALRVSPEGEIKEVLRHNPQVGIGLRHVIALTSAIIPLRALGVWGREENLLVREIIALLSEEDQRAIKEESLTSSE